MFLSTVESHHVYCEFRYTCSTENKSKIIQVIFCLPYAVPSVGLGFCTPVIVWASYIKNNYIMLCKLTPNCKHLYILHLILFWRYSDLLNAEWKTGRPQSNDPLLAYNINYNADEQWRLVKCGGAKGILSVWDAKNNWGKCLKGHAVHVCVLTSLLYPQYILSR